MANDDILFLRRNFSIFSYGSDDMIMQPAAPWLRRPEKDHKMGEGQARVAGGPF